MIATVNLKSLGRHKGVGKTNASRLDIELIIVRSIWIGIFAMFIFLGLTGRLDNQSANSLTNHHAETINVNKTQTGLAE